MPPRSNVSELTDHLGYWLRQVSNNVSLSFARRIEAEGVTVAEWVVLRILFGAEDLAPSRLANMMGMTKGAISKLSDRLVAKGLIERTGSPVDARAHTLALTGDGKRLVPKLAALADENDRIFFAPLKPNQREKLRQLLEQLVECHGLREPPTE